MLSKLFGNAVIEKVLFYILKNKTTYASQLRTIFNQPLYSFQRALDRLEQGSIIISHLKGKTRLYQFNSRYPFLKELQAFLEKAYISLPEEFQTKYYTPPIRKRPRRKGKPL